MVLLLLLLSPILLLPHMMNPHSSYTSHTPIINTPNCCMILDSTFWSVDEREATNRSLPVVTYIKIVITTIDIPIRYYYVIYQVNIMSWTIHSLPSDPPPPPRSSIQTAGRHLSKILENNGGIKCGRRHPLFEHITLQHVRPLPHLPPLPHRFPRQQKHRSSQRPQHTHEGWR